MDRRPRTVTGGRVRQPTLTSAETTAGAAIAEVFELGQVGRVNEILAESHKNSDVVPADLPPLLRSFFQEMSALPTWADQARMERGSDVFGRYAPHVASILHCVSLPVCYGGAKGVEVLYRSKRIHGQVFRRIMETAQFVVDALDKGGLGPRGRGRRSAQKIRLLHATIRHFMRNDWDMSRGLPINQEDLAATIFSFSVVVPRGLKNSVRMSNWGNRYDWTVPESESAHANADD